jgi:hypothetical protein
MNYQKIYNQLINNAKDRILDSYTESHHIIPKCLGGDNSKENLVNLTPEEHYIAHQLLVKLYPNNKKIIFAAHMMTVSNGRRNNKTYGWVRRKMSEAQSGKGNHMYGKTLTDDERKARGSSGEANPFYGRNHSEESKKKISDSKLGKNKGRTPWNKGIAQTEETKQKIRDNSPWKGTKGSGTHPSVGRKTSDETKKKLSKIFKGKKMDEDFIKKISKPKGPQVKVICPHCKKEGGASNMNRYHFENCKDKL